MTWLQKEEVQEDLVAQEDRVAQDEVVLEELALDANAHLEEVLVKPKDEQ